MVGLFDYLRVHHKLKASKVKRMLDLYPELVMQNRGEQLVKKFKLIKENAPHLDKVYLRNLFKRHPDMFLRSYGSMQAKVYYLNRTLNRQLAKEKAFPLLLHYSFTGHIWPRCEVLRDIGAKSFDLVEALTGTDEEFCKKFRITR